MRSVFKERRPWFFASPATKSIKSPGSTPTRTEAAPFSPAQKRDNTTHRRPFALSQGSPIGDLFAGSLRQGRGAGVRPAGQRLATDNRHRVDTDLYEGPASVSRGAGAGAGYCLGDLSQPSLECAPGTHRYLIRFIMVFSGWPLMSFRALFFSRRLC